MRALRLIVLSLAVCAGAATAAHAHESRASYPSASVRLAARGMSLDEAVALAERRFHARVVRAETRNEGGHTVYVLRLLNESGRVWIVQIDAESGAVR